MKFLKSARRALFHCFFVIFLASVASASPFVNPKDDRNEDEARQEIEKSGQAKKAEDMPWNLVELYKASKTTAEKFGIPQELLLAIGIQESGLWPWTVNYEGRISRKFRTKEDLIAWLRDNNVTWKRSFDLGAMQVNSQWANKFGYDVYAILDIQKNMDFAGYLLKEGFSIHGVTWRGVSSYHTPHASERAVEYARKVVRIMTKIIYDTERSK